VIVTHLPTPPYNGSAPCSSDRCNRHAVVTNTGVREVITTLKEVQQRLGLVQALSDDFFTEWTADLPPLTAQEQLSIDRLKQRYDYHRTGGLLLEGTINLVVTAPLLSQPSLVLRRSDTDRAA